MDGYSISQVAERTGFPPTTLRYYEQSGLVRPGRTPAGYRRYDDRHLELLSFIARAKGLGLSLDEIGELVALLDGDECAPVQGRLRELVATKIADARAEVAELDAFAAELQRVSASLDGHTPDGPCDDACGCTVDRGDGDEDLSVPIALGRDIGNEPIACTLSADQLGARLDEWRSVVAEATGREEVAGGTRLRFRRDVDVARLATLIAAEQGCCRFFTFTLTVAVDDVALEVLAPADARPVVDALVGVVR